MILLSCCTEMEIKGDSLIGLFLTDWRRYFQALWSFWHRGSAAKLPFFFKNYGLDCWVNPYKTFSTWSHIERVRSLRGILAWNWHSWAHTLWSIRICVFIFLCICVFFLCICLFLSVFLTFLYVLLKQQSWAQPFKFRIGQKFSQFLETRTQWGPADATSYYTC